MTIKACDISSYQWDTIFPFQAMKDNEFKLVLIKSSMGGGPDWTCDKFVDTFRNNSFDIGLWHWVDPTQNLEKQTNFFLDKIHKHKPDCVFLDQEQFWANWPDFYKLKAGQLTYAKLPKLSKDKINNAGTTIIGLLWDELLTLQIPFDTYTGKWFIDDYCGKVWPWVKHTNPWLAVNITLTTAEKNPKTWNDFNNTINNKILPYKPDLPTGISKYGLLQFSSGVTIPGSNKPFDLDLFNGNIDDYTKWLNQPPLKKWSEATLEDKLELLKRILKEHKYLDNLDNIYPK